MKHIPTSKRQTDLVDKEIRLLQQSISVPLHHPDFMKKFKEVDPTFPERILQMTEAEMLKQHSNEDRKIKMEEKKLNHTIIETYIGLFCAFIFAILVFCGSIYLIKSGFTIIGGIISWSVLASIVYAFIQGRNK